MNRSLFLSIVVCSGILVFLNFFFSPSMATSEPFCFFTLLGTSIAGSSCPLTGTPTVISNAFGHVGSTNGYLYFDEEEYYNYMIAGEPHQDKDWWMHLSAQELAKDCRYDNNGNFFTGPPNFFHLTDNQKRVLSDLQANYSVFICPFTGTPTRSMSTTSGLSGPISSGTVNVMNLTNTSSNNVTTNKTSTTIGTSVYNDTSSNGTGVHSADPQHAVEYLVKEGLVRIHSSGNSSNSVSTHVPSWIQNTVSMWRSGEISNSEFVVEIQYLTDNGIVKISSGQ